MNLKVTKSPAFLSRVKLFMSALVIASITLTSCGGAETSANDEKQDNRLGGSQPTAEAPKADDGKGVGPISNIELPATVDKTMAEKGHSIFEAKCSACHNADDSRKVGPGVQGITERRKPEWIMNMILNPEVMVKEDPQAQELLAEYMAPMANQNLTEEEARAVLEYFRQNDGK